MKYSTFELNKMANRLLVAKANNDERYLEFCFAMMVRTGAPLETIEQKIAEFAEVKVKR